MDRITLRRGKQRIASRLLLSGEKPHEAGVLAYTIFLTRATAEDPKATPMICLQTTHGKIASSRMSSKTQALILAFCLSGTFTAAAEDTPLLTCSEIHGLSPAEAAGERKVSLRGVVTFFDKRTNSSLFIQDDKGGIYVRVGAAGFDGALGDRVEILGRTAPGDFAPIVILESYRILGPGILPEPLIVSQADLESGRGDCIRIRFRSRVRSVSFGSIQAPTIPPRLVIELGDHKTDLVQAHLLDWGDLNPQSLIDAEVELTGVSSGSFNQRRQILLGRIQLSDFPGLRIITPPPPADEIPSIRIGDLFTFGSGTSQDRMVNVEGVVVASNAPDWLAVQDGKSGIFLKPAPLGPIKIGTLVKVSGYPSQKDLQILLLGARVEELGQVEVPAAAELDNFDESSRFHGCRVKVRGTLLEPPALSAGIARIRMMVEGGTMVAEIPGCESLPQEWQPGAILSVVGVCLAEKSAEEMARRFPQADRVTIYAGAPSDIAVLTPASWWTITRVFRVLGVLLAALVGAALVVLYLSLKARRLATSGQEAIRAERLRTEQLHEQHASRHEQQLAFRAVLLERQRLAQELHDSLEQEFASLSLQTEAAISQLSGDAAAMKILEKVRKCVDQSRGEARRCVWGLRARALDHGGIVAALNELAEQHNAGIGSQLMVDLVGPPVSLEPSRENHLFRFAQEAIGNAIKHANASEILLRIEWNPAGLEMVVKDNGQGMPQGCTGSTALRKRADDLCGTLEMTARKPLGTSVRLRLDFTEAEKSQ